MENQYMVVLRVYPLGDERMKEFVGSVLGRSDAGIWHTSIEVYGTEYYFQNGIMQAAPGTTIHGTPVKTHSLGYTEIPKIVFEDFLLSVADDFSPYKYHLLRNNCNNFTNAVSMYLVEKSIPKYILELQEAAQESEVFSSMVDMVFGAPRQI